MHNQRSKVPHCLYFIGLLCDSRESVNGGLANGGLIINVFVHNCPRLPSIVATLRQKFPLEIGLKGLQKCTIVDDCAQIAESGLEPRFRSSPGRECDWEDLSRPISQSHTQGGSLKPFVKQSRNKNAMVAAILDCVLDRDWTRNRKGPLRYRFQSCKANAPAAESWENKQEKQEKREMYRSSQNYYRQSCYSWEFIFPKVPLPLPSWNSDEVPLPLPSWRPQSPLHFHWFPITVLKVIWINFPKMTATVTVLNVFELER